MGCVFWYEKAAERGEHVNVPGIAGVVSRGHGDEEEEKAGEEGHRDKREAGRIWSPASA